MTSWSSRGPTYDGRAKPDIVAPGYNIYSANGNVGKDSCSTTDMAGTSMSAPIVAGNAALVRQYFRDGYYPCGAKGCGESIAPSGSLVKAVLVNGAQNLRGVQSVPGGSVRSISEYDNTQNMGIVKLNRSLSLQGENISTHTLSTTRRLPWEKLTLSTLKLIPMVARSKRSARPWFGTTPQRRRIVPTASGIILT